MGKMEKLHREKEEKKRLELLEEEEEEVRPKQEPPSQPPVMSVRTRSDTETRARKVSLPTGPGGSRGSRPRNSSHTSRSRSRSKSSERILKQLEKLGPACGKDIVEGIYLGEYQNQAWVFVGEISSGGPRRVRARIWNQRNINTKCIAGVYSE